MTQSLALAFALLGAIGYGAASVLQAIGAGHQAGTLRTLIDPVYLAGVVLDLLAWLASLVALRTLPVYQVQSLLAGSIAVTVLLARTTLGHRLRRVDLAAIGVTVLALAVLAASSGPQQPIALSSPDATWLALAAIGVALLGLGAVRARLAEAAGALAGLAFGGAALCARAVVLPPDVVHHLTRLASDPLIWGLLGYGVTGMLLYAQALENGAVGPVTALLWITEVVAPSLVGVLLLGDTVRDGWLPFAVVAVLAAVLSAAVLALSESRYATDAAVVLPDTSRTASPPPR
jgi:drug/metabolite transporter (DMT)-like permease